MINLKFDAFKSGFFDRKAVTSAVDKATRRVLSKFGAFVRTRARTSIRNRKGTSPPLGPPYSHTKLLKRFIFFAYDKTRESVVIGPARLNQVRSRNAPPALEYGGTSTVLEGGRRGRPEQVRVRPRPFMRPAMAKEQAQLPKLWRDAVK